VNFLYSALIKKKWNRIYSNRYNLVV